MASLKKASGLSILSLGLLAINAVMSGAEWEKIVNGKSKNVNDEVCPWFFLSDGKNLHQDPTAGSGGRPCSRGPYVLP